MTEYQEGCVQDAIDHADINPFEAMRRTIESLAGTETDIKESGAAVISIPAPFVLEVLAKLDPLALALPMLPV